MVAIDFTPFIEREVFDALEARVAGGERAFFSLEDVKAYLRSRYPRLPEDAIDRRARHGYECVGRKMAAARVACGDA